MNAKEVAAAKDAGGEVIHVPVTIGAVAIIYNLPGVSGLKLTGEVLADIYLKKLTTWNDPRIAALNPEANLPAAPIGPADETKTGLATSLANRSATMHAPCSIESARCPAASACSSPTPC